MSFPSRSTPPNQLLPPTQKKKRVETKGESQDSQTSEAKYWQMLDWSHRHNISITLLVCHLHSGYQTVLAVRWQMFATWEHQALKHCTAEVSLATNTVLQHRISYYCHHPACMPDLCNHTNKSCYSAYYWKRTEITVHQHFPSSQHPFHRSPRVPCLYSFPSESLNGSQSEKLLYHCSKLNANQPGHTWHVKMKGLELFQNAYCILTFLCQAESLVRQASPELLPNHRQNAKPKLSAFH